LGCELGFFLERICGGYEIMVFLLVVESPGDVRARFFITTHRLLYSWPAGEMYTKIRHPRGGI